MNKPAAWTIAEDVANMGWNVVIHGQWIMDGETGKRDVFSARECNDMEAAIERRKQWLRTIQKLSGVECK